MTEQTNGGGKLDDALQREIDEALGGKSLEDLLAEAGPKAPPAGELPPDVEPGQVRPGRVLSIDRDMVLVTLGGKDQGMVPLEQFDDSPRVGQDMEFAVVRYNRDDDLWVLSRKGAVEHATWEDLQQGSIVEGFVEGLNKGGLEVRFSGIKAFMPLSQVSLHRVEDASELLRTKIKCQVVEVNRREKRVVVSARAVQEAEAQQKREQLLETLQEGDVREGVVRQVVAFGAFVDLGGVDGLVHVSQMSHARVDDPATVVQPGQRITVKVLKIDRQADRISLGMKQVQPDPWESVEAAYPVGATVSGTVTRLENFGAFCQLTPGVEGLIPISEMTWTKRLRHPGEMLKVGQAVEVKVLSVEPDRKRISLSVKQSQANPWSGVGERYALDSEQPGKVTRITDFGAFVELEPGVEGLVHISQLSDQHVRRVSDVVQAGQDVRVRVLEVDENARRISLSMKTGAAAAAAAPLAAAPEAPKKKRKKPLKGGLD